MFLFFKSSLMSSNTFLVLSLILVFGVLLSPPESPGFSVKGVDEVSLLPSLSTCERSSASPLAGLTAEGSLLAGSGVELSEEEPIVPVSSIISVASEEGFEEASVVVELVMGFIGFKVKSA